jgi:hypothetical protein
MSRADIKPMTYVKMRVENSMTPILDALARKYRPLAGMYIITTTTTTNIDNLRYFIMDLHYGRG